MMSFPGYIAEASLYQSPNPYPSTPRTAATSGDRVLPAQLGTCSVGAVCFAPDRGFVCNCPAGTTCKRRRLPPRCYLTCFLWWCWTRCESSQLVTYDSFCDP
jgi:hypothetical protein